MSMFVSNIKKRLYRYARVELGNHYQKGAQGLWLGRRAVKSKGQRGKRYWNNPGGGIGIIGFS